MASRIVDFKYNYNGYWTNNGEDLVYANGLVEVIGDFDCDYLTYDGIEAKYITLGVVNVKNIFLLEPGKRLVDGLFLVSDDESVRKGINLVSKYSWVQELELYEDHDLDVLIYHQPVLAVEYHGDGIGAGNIDTGGAGDDASVRGGDDASVGI